MRDKTTTTSSMLLKTIFTCSSVSTSRSCGFYLWAVFMEEARREVDNLLGQKVVE